MDLDEMKTAWTDMSAKMEQQKKLTDQLIMDMTKVKYNSLLNKVAIPETSGGIICYALILGIIFNFPKFDTPLLVASAIACILILGIPSTLSLLTLHRLKNINIINTDAKRYMEHYLNGRRKFLSIQKSSLILSFILVLVGPLVMYRVIGKPDDILTLEKWLKLTPFAVVAFILFAWPSYRYFERMMKKVDNVLKELE